jgi:hypothetical protein
MIITPVLKTYQGQFGYDYMPSICEYWTHCVRSSVNITCPFMISVISLMNQKQIFVITHSFRWIMKYFNICTSAWQLRIFHCRLHITHRCDSVHSWNLGEILAILTEVLLNFPQSPNDNGQHSNIVDKALCYKLEGRGFDTRWGEFLNLPNPSGRTGPGVSQPLTEMSTRIINIKMIMFLGSKEVRVRKADNLTAIYEPIV